MIDAATEALARRQTEIGRSMTAWDQLPESERDAFRSLGRSS